jgi:GTPase SAR1 family protein
MKLKRSHYPPFVDLMAESLLPPSTTQPQPQILLIFCGLPGSGKTLLSEALVRHSAPESAATQTKRKWVRASQDDAPARRRQQCEAVARQALAEGNNVVVDRVGFDPAYITTRQSDVVLD